MFINSINQKHNGVIILVVHGVIFYNFLEGVSTEMKFIITLYLLFYSYHPHAVATDIHSDSIST